MTAEPMVVVGVGLTSESGFVIEKVVALAGSADRIIAVHPSRVRVGLGRSRLQSVPASNCQALLQNSSVVLLILFSSETESITRA